MASLMDQGAKLKAISLGLPGLPGSRVKEKCDGRWSNIRDRPIDGGILVKVRVVS